MTAEKCPYCEREFGGIRSFPLIKIVEFKRIPLPDIIDDSGIGDIPYHPEKVQRRHWLFWKKLIDNPDLPQEVLKEFRRTAKEVISYQGRVYKRDDISRTEKTCYQISNDLTKIIRGMVNNERVKATLYSLERCVGKEIKKQDLFSLPAFLENRFEAHNETFWLELYDETEIERKNRAYLSKLEGKQIGDERICEVVLSARPFSISGAFVGYEINQKLVSTQLSEAKFQFIVVYCEVCKNILKCLSSGASES